MAVKGSLTGFTIVDLGQAMRDYLAPSFWGTWMHKLSKLKPREWETR